MSFLSRFGSTALLDVAKQTYKEATITQLSETHDLGFDLKYDSARQYYISLQTTEMRALPDLFINVYRKKTASSARLLTLSNSIRI
ncbi:hypothetical protein BDW75DRAFT_204848 [Aspergillus navahoensis]